MKRILLGLVMASGLALLVAPMANAQNAGLECGHNYGFLATGAEPVTATTAAATYPLNYIAGVGVLKFGALGSAGTGQCTVGGEMIYIDNDYETFQGGPSNCTVPSAFGELPCFNGVDTMIEGGTGPGPNGSITIELGATFQTVVGDSNMADVTLPFDFTVFVAKSAATMEGNSNIPPGGTAAGDTNGNGPCDEGLDPWGCGPNSPEPPLGPVLSITLQEQATTAALNPIPTTYGKAPYAGSAATLCTGFGGNSTDLVASGQATQTDEATGTYGATSGSLNVFADGLASGSLTFNSNDDVGNTTGISNYDCDFQQENVAVYADGTTNNEALINDVQFYNPYTAGEALTCRDADAGVTGVGEGNPVGADEVNSSVVWGASDQDGYTIVTGVATPALLGGAFLPPGETATCTSLQETPAAGKVSIIKPTTPIVSTGNTVVTEGLAIDNTSEAACAVTVAMPTVTGLVHDGGQCTISLAGAGSPFDSPAPGSPVKFGVEAFSNTATYANVNCVCSNGTATGAKAASTMTITATQCEFTGAATIALTCEN
jgi:hypothetical protein